MSNMSNDFIPDHPAKVKVSCCNCGRDFEGFNEGQAADCATEVHETYLHGHYGSSVADMQILRFAAGAAHGLTVGGTVCDPCITQMIADGRVSVDQDFSWM